MHTFDIFVSDEVWAWDGSGNSGPGELCGSATYSSENVVQEYVVDCSQTLTGKYVYVQHASLSTTYLLTFGEVEVYRPGEYQEV